MNQKFENLVRKCYFEAPKWEKEVEAWKKKTEEKRNEYFELCKQLEQVHDLINTLQLLERYGEIAVRKAKYISEDRTVFDDMKGV